MSKKAIVWLVIGCSLILIGAIIFVGVMFMIDWDIKKLSNVKYISNEYEISEEIKSISIESDTADIAFIVSDGQNSSVSCYEQSKVTHSVNVVDGVLKIELVDTRKWYEYISIGFENSKITIVLPAGEYESLYIKEHTGDINITNDFSFESIDISATTGDVSNGASSSGIMKIKVSTGNIFTEGVSADLLDLSVSTGKINASKIDCAGELKIQVSTGKVNLADVSCESFTSKGGTGDIYLKNVLASDKLFIERSTGDVSFDGSDAAGICVKTDTGDVEGTLLSDKVFVVKTDTGKINVPSSLTGGKCEIETDTGDIKISIK